MLILWLGGALLLSALVHPASATDGRFCFGIGQVSAAIYDDGRGGINFYAVDSQDQGVKVFSVSALTLSRLDDAPEKPVLIGSNYKYIGIEFYKLPSGEYQINAGPNQDGEVFACIFNAIPDTDVRIDTFKIGN